MRTLCLRFDIDTELCLREGMTTLMEMADTFGFQFTAFIAPGRSVDRIASLKRVFSDRHNSETSAHLSSFKKLGAREYVHLMLFNKQIMNGHAGLLRSLENAGHDLGLHGGTNHGTWQRFAHRWGKERLLQEIDFGLMMFREAKLRRPVMFASPGWTSPAPLPDALRERGFQLLADEHGTDSPAIRGNGLRIVNTRLTGEPGGIGYVEHLAACTRSTQEALEIFEKDLDEAGDIAVLYDHPFFAGRGGLSLLNQLLKRATDLGREIVPISALITES